MELTKNEGDGAVWDVRSFCDVITNFVKVEVETVYTVLNNGFKEIQFYHDDCLTGLFVCLFVCLVVYLFVCLFCLFCLFLCFIVVVFVR